MSAWVRAPIALFLAGCLALGGVIAAALAMRSAVRRADTTVTVAVLSSGKVERLRSLRERVSRKVRSYLLLRDERFLAEVRESERAFGELLAELRGATRAAEKQDVIGRIARHEEARRVVTGQLITLQAEGGSADAVARLLEADQQPILDALDGELRELITLHQRDVEAARATSSDTFARATVGLGIAAALAMLVMGLTAVALGRSLRRIEGRAARLERERNQFFELSIDMVCIAGTDGYFKQLNPSFEAGLGYTGAELRAEPFLSFVHADDQAATAGEVAKLTRGETSIDFENRYRCKDGRYKWLSWHATAEPSGVIYAVARDVTERKSHQEELRRLAILDELTGINNRRGFNLLAEQHLKHVERTRQRTVFFFADLDGLKQINDQLGHDAGDAAIRAAAVTIAAAFRKSDIVARLGGDEFVILAADATPDSADTIIARLQDLVARFNATSPPFVLAISIGWTLHDPATPESLDDVLKRADAMMYAQKLSRRGPDRRR